MQKHIKFIKTQKKDLQIHKKTLTNVWRRHIIDMQTQIYIS